MLRFRWFAVGCVLSTAVAMFVGFEAVRGQTGKKPAEISPEQFFSADTVAYFRYDGTKAHHADWEKTAAYKALVKSGLTKSIDEWLTKLSEQEPKAEVAQKFMWHLLENGFSVGIIPSDIVPQGPPELTVLLHNGASLDSEITEWISSEFKVVQETSTLNGKERQQKKVYFPGSGDCVAWWSEGNHFVLTVGNNAESAMNVLDGKSKGITTLPEWQRRNALPDGQILTGVAWIDTQRIIEKYRNVEIPDGPNGKAIKVGDILSLLGVDNLTEFIGRQGYDGEVCVSNVDILLDGPRRGALKLLGGKSMTLDDLPPLPEYATTIMTSSVDAANAYDCVMEIIAKAMDQFGAPEKDREEFANGLKQADEAVGGSLRDDVLANLGPVHTFFNDPTNGIGGFGFGYAVKAKESDKLKTALDRLLQLIPEPQGDDEPRVMRNANNGRDYISFGQPGIPFFPTLTIHDGWLVAGLSTQTVGAFYDRKAGELEKWSPTEEHQKLLEKLPQEFVSMSINDPREWIRAANQYLPFIQGAMASSPETQGFPLPTLPSSDRIARSIFPTVSVTTIDDVGVHYRTRLALPGLPLFGTMDNMSVGTSAVAVALLLPAVQQAREAARRTQSKNHLKQLMLAVHNYHDVHNEFPRGTLPRQEKPEDSLSWCVAILPYIDQAALSQKLDENKTWDADANKLAGQTAIQTFRNPSATDVDLDGYAQTDYAGVAGLGKDGPKKKVSDKGAGIFANFRSTKIRDITDGTSNTVMFGEVIKERGPWIQGGKATIRPFVEKPYINGPDGWGGNHTGGAFFSMADGSVRFISENIDPKTMEALITIQGGEVVGDF